MRTGTHIILTSLGLLAALLWRDMFNSGIDLARVGLVKVFSTQTSRYPALVEGTIRVLLALAATAVIVVVFVRLSPEDTGQPSPEDKAEA